MRACKRRGESPTRRPKRGLQTDRFWFFFFCQPCMYVFGHMCVCVCMRVVLKRTAPAEQQQAQWLRGSGVHFKTDLLAHRLHVFMPPPPPPPPPTYQIEWSLCCVIPAFTRRAFLIRLCYARRGQGSGRPCDSDTVDGGASFLGCIHFYLHHLI